MCIRDSLHTHGTSQYSRPSSHTWNKSVQSPFFTHMEQVSTAALLHTHGTSQYSRPSSHTWNKSVQSPFFTHMEQVSTDVLLHTNTTSHCSHSSSHTGTSQRTRPSPHIRTSQYNRPSSHTCGNLVILPHTQARVFFAHVGRVCNLGNRDDWHRMQKGLPTFLDTRGTC